MHQTGLAYLPSLFRVLVLAGVCALASARADDVVNTAAVSFDGTAGAVTLNTNVVRAMLPDDPPAGVLFVQKNASRSIAEIGDFVDYTVAIKNVSPNAVPDALVEDRLPFGFSFQKGSARLNGVVIPDPTEGVGPLITLSIGRVDPGKTLTLTYRVRIGVDASHGDGVNRAQARSTAGPLSFSNIATALVELRAGVFTNRSVIIGKVFVDQNKNRVQDAGEPGVPGVRLYLEDGSYVITDGEGKYSFYGISPRTHVVKLDRITLPPNAELEPLNTRNAGDGGSVFVEAKGAELRKVNFAIGNATPEIIAYVTRMIAATEANDSGEVSANLRNNLDRNGTQTLAVDRRSLPSSGLIYPGVSVQPTSQDRTQSADSVVLGGARSEVGALPTNSFRGFGSAPPTSVATPTDPLNPPAIPLPSVTLEQALTANGNTDSFGFVDLKDRDTLPATQAAVRVKSVAGASVILRVNGVPVPATRVGKKVTMSAEGIEAIEFIGVQLRPGENTLEVVQMDQYGNPRGAKSITVIAPDKLGRISIHTPDDATADGKTPARIAVELLDDKGVPVTARTALTLEASLGQWLAPDLNPREPGTQVFIEGGHAEFALAAPVEPGESHVRISSGLMESDTLVSFLPELRPLIAAGVIEGVINTHHLSGGSLLPVSSRDTFENELHDFATSGNDGHAAGRAAFFLKGKVLGSYLLTAAYDSEKDTRDHLFRDIQPDEFYPVYGDSSIKGFEAQSTGRLFVRVDHKRSYLLYGDFVTQAPNDIQQLGNYNRSLNGVREHFENKTVSANAWASYDNTRQSIEELRANGTSGPYGFRASNGLVNSEKIEIITRDRDNPGLIIKTVSLTRFSDYEFEPLTGQILFKAPIPSLDADLNPISIRVTYEVDQGGDRFWVYGADAQVKVHPRAQIGGAFARDENPLGHYGLYSGNAVFDLGRKTLLFGEFAHSEDALVGDGNAGRIELRHSSEKIFARLFWGRADTNFKNPSAILTAGRTEGGAQVSYQVGKKTRVLVQAVDTETQEGGSRRGALLGIEQTFGSDIRLELDGRYSKETTAPASPSTAETPGATPNEVRSLRTKLTLPLPYTQGAGRVYGEYEQDLWDADKRLGALGGEFQVDAKTRIYVRHEFISSLGGPFELNSVQRQNTTVFGVESTYAKDAALFNEYRARDGFSGREAETAVGLRNAWTLADGLRLSTSFERVDPLEGANTTTKSTAVTGALEYTANPDWKGTARLELRSSDTVDSLLNTFGLAYKLSDNWTALGRSVLYLAENKGLDGVDQRQARVQGGFAWRQTTADVWNALGKYEFRTENGAPGTFNGGLALAGAGEVQRRVNILSLDVNCQPSADWQLSGHYAGKLAYDDSINHNDATSAHLVGGRVIYDLMKRVDLGFSASALVDGNGAVQYTLGPEIGFTIVDNLRAAIGYNFRGFDDHDLTQEQYTSGGFYLALRLKFDESLFSRRKEGK